MDIGWLWCIYVGLSIETTVHHLVENVDNRGGYTCVEEVAV